MTSWRYFNLTERGKEPIVSTFEHYEDKKHFKFKNQKSEFAAGKHTYQLKQWLGLGILELYVFQ